MAEMVLGMEFLHRQSILHRDIRLENTFLGADGHALIGGFSLSDPEWSGVAREMVGTPYVHSDVH